MGGKTLIIDVCSRRAEARIAMLAFAACALAPGLITILNPAVLGPALAFAVSSAAFALVWRGLWRAGWLSADHRIAGFSWLSDGRWRLTDSRNRTVEGVLCPDSRVAGGFVWLRWDTTDALPPRRKSMLLLAGDIPERDLRRLIVRLRLDGANFPWGRQSIRAVPAGGHGGRGCSRVDRKLAPYRDAGQ